MDGLVDSEMEAEIAKRIDLSMAERMVLVDELAKLESALFRMKAAVEDGDYVAMGRAWATVGMPIEFIQQFLANRAQQAAQQWMMERNGGQR